MINGHMELRPAFCAFALHSASKPAVAGIVIWGYMGAQTSGLHRDFLQSRLKCSNEPPARTIRQTAVEGSLTGKVVA